MSRILIIEDEDGSLRELAPPLTEMGHKPVLVRDGRGGLALLKTNGRVELAIIDLKAKGLGGFGFLKKAKELQPGISIIITTPLSPILFKQGTFYRITKSLIPPYLKTILDEILMSKRRVDEARRQEFQGIIGGNREMNHLYQLIERVAPSSATVLLEGESGTGKELIAKALHQLSPRKSFPFVCVNCAAIPTNLIESEMFGHEKGAFTGAFVQRPGKFESAHGGTIFLDEIGELDKELQVKLLRVIQDKEFQRVGGNRSIKVDVRIIAATNKDLKMEVELGQFRKDLFYRLNVVNIKIPPLRERREDIPLLIRHFLKVISGKERKPILSLSPEAMDALLNYSYPGNVRELENFLERVMVTLKKDLIELRDLPDEVFMTKDQGVYDSLFKSLPSNGVPLREMEKDLIRATLEKTFWNKSKAARVLGISRRLLYRRLKEYNIEEMKL
jgi:DNA-binding NtrC family response regulator